MLTDSPTEYSIRRGPVRPDLLRAECLNDILAATARRSPERTALIWGKRRVSYRELAHSAEKIGRACHANGARAGKIIGLLMQRGADLLMAQAGISASGAAWLPFDAETPLARVGSCLQAAGAIGLVTCREWLPRCAHLPVPVWAVEDLLTDINSADSPNPPSPDDPAYVIYTSGSTGEPKGIVISHRSICHFLRSENEVIGVRTDDRVYQGFSVAFDMSFEEIWISYLVGATLWIAPAELVGDADALAATWQREQITVVHAVPTLMAMVHPPLPSLRLLNLGGEACPDALVTRFARPGLKIFNTYGPTEASVSASIAELKIGEAVTIGLPLPNYTLIVVNAEHQPVLIGEAGELCIGGPGLAVGYLGRPDLTAARFVQNPVATNSSDARMYLTGDLARMAQDGVVQFLGRADSQVKVRGFRIELDEITAVLTQQPGVAGAATVVRKLGEADEIVSFYVTTKTGGAQPESLRQALKSRLPAYMVPAHFEALDELPRLVSGKIDSKTLATVPLNLSGVSTGQHAARTADEAALFKALQPLFPGRTFQPDADFFDDLGGHSLLVARLVSALRAEPHYSGIGLQDIYRERALAAIAGAMGKQREQYRPVPVTETRVNSTVRRVVCGVAQAVAVPFFVLLHVADWLAPFFVYHYFTGEEDDSVVRAILYSLMTFVLAQGANFVLAVVGKRLVANKLPAGQHPLWGVTYFRWWLAGKFCDLPDMYLLAATPWINWFYRALGARVGREVMLEQFTVGAPEWLTIDDGVSVGTFVTLANARVEGGWLIIGPVHLGRDSVIESYAALENDTELGERARLGGQSALRAGGKIPAGENWEGAPARHVRREFETLPPRPTIPLLRQILQALGFGLSAIFVAVLFFLPIFPAFMLIDWLDAHTWDFFEADFSPLVGFGFFFLLAIPASAVLVLLTMVITAGLQRLLPRQTAGRASVHSVAFWRKKFMSMVLDASLQSLHGLYASVFAPAWLRLLGARVGQHAEVSTASGMVPELLSLGDDSFIADGAMLGDEEQRGGWMILKPTAIGNRTFVGNGAYVPDGTTVPDDVLIGVQTRAPDNAQLKPGQTWMGSPPLLLPAREQLAGFPEALTFRPSRWRRIARGFIEALRIVLPLALVIAAGYLIVILVMPLAEDYGWGLHVAGALALAGCAFGFGALLLVLALKWLVVGRYRPRAAPMWTPFVWLSEAVTNLYESLAVPGLLDLLRGTPMLPWALRLFGARIGCGVYLDTTDLTEFDCVEIGAGAELNEWCGPQTHLFEDRVMKIGRVKIGKGVTVGARSTILYDSCVGDDVRLGALTLVAKGEALPAKTRWEGSPAARAR